MNSGAEKTKKRTILNDRGLIALKKERKDRNRG
jgi:hypothetical protein